MESAKQQQHSDQHSVIITAKDTIKLYNNPYSKHKIELTDKSSSSYYSSNDEYILGCAIDPTDEAVALALGDGTVRICHLSNPSHHGPPVVIKTHTFDNDQRTKPALACLKWKKLATTPANDESSDMQDYQIGEEN